MSTCNTEKMGDIVKTQSRPYSNAINMLRKFNLRPTKQRMALAKMLFEQEPRHFTAEELYNEAHTMGIDISLATVYNTLHQFSETGLIREIMVGSNRCYFDTNTTNHHHFFFERSGKLEDVEDSMLQVTGNPQLPNGLKISRIDVIVRVDG